MNIALLALAIFLGLAYVVAMNDATAGRYRLRALRDQAAALTDQHGSLVSRQTQVLAPESLNAFAQGYQLVLSREIFYIFENGKVAFGTAQ